MTSLSVSISSKSLLQIGVSLADIALLIHHGRRFGNFFQASKNDKDLLEALNEDPGELIKRRGLVEPIRMASRWSTLDFVYEGRKRTSAGKEIGCEQDLTSFAWLMVTVIAALDLCLSPEKVQRVIMTVIATVLDRKGEVEESLNMLLPASIESWRSVGRVCRMSQSTASTYAGIRSKFEAGQAIPQLNPTEIKEVINFLVWLMKAESTHFSALSVDILAIATCISQAGILLRTRGKATYESEPVVQYCDNPSTIDLLEQHQYTEEIDPYRVRNGNQKMVQQVSYPFGQPEAMIQSIRVHRSVLNEMEVFWDLGKKAALKFKLVGKAEYPFSPALDVMYYLEGDDGPSARYDTGISMLADNGFPVSSAGVLHAIEQLIQKKTKNCAEWLHQFSGHEMLQKSNDSAIISQCKAKMTAWLYYQAVVFGFYYKLLEGLVDFTLVSSCAFFQGLWGYGSTTFLAMCTDFGRKLRNNGPVPRSQVLHMLSAMYNGRQRPWTSASSQPGLVGILGSISIVTKPLLHNVDTPEEIARFMILDLPVIDLASDTDGEIFAGQGNGIDFKMQPGEARAVIPRSPKGKWSLHAKIGMHFQERSSGVYMAAKCSGRLVGYFNPVAADVTFLSEAYVNYQNPDDPKDSINGFEVTDSDWQNGCVPRVYQENTLNSYGLVHSMGCPALRYAAAGFYVGGSEEVAISNGDIGTAFGRVEAQECGIIIA